MKTIPEIEALLSHWYGPQEMNKVLTMSKEELCAEADSLLVCQPSSNLSDAANGILLLIETL